jgi:antagonist of KipI
LFVHAQATSSAKQINKKRQNNFADIFNKSYAELMSILLETNGILTTVQDLGRNGFRSFGVNPSGATDKQAVRLINILLENDENEAVIELHFPAPKIRFEKDAIIALGGADFGAKINNNPIENWRCVSVEKGSLLEFTDRNFGARCYLSVKGGFETEIWLESASTNLLANIGHNLQKNNQLSFKDKGQMTNDKTNKVISSSLIPYYSKFPTVRIVAGAEFENLTALSEQNLLKKSFTISNQSDRMGFRLEGEPLYLLSSQELISSAVNFGTIQLLPNGQMIILMADHQTTGGYPRIAHIISPDLPLLAQLNPNDKVAFHLISHEHAEEILLQNERDLNWLKLGVKFG